MKTRQGGTHGPDVIHWPKTVEDAHAQYIRAWRRDKASYERRNGQASDIHLVHVTLLEEFTAVLASIMGTAICGQCPRGRTADGRRRRPACKHLIEIDAQP